MTAAARQVEAVTSIRVLGSWQVRSAGRRVELPAGQLRVVLASLLLTPDQPVSLETLAGRLWPQRAPARSGGAVHTYMSRLRGLLGPDLIETVPGGYRLSLDEQAIDLHRFRALCRQARAAGPGELPLLRQALALWRGRPFGGMSSAWLDEVVPALTEEWFAATERRIDLELESGPVAPLIAELTELANRYRTREGLWLRLITTLHLAGRRAEALDRYHVLRAVLRDELGVDPGEDAARLHRELLRAESATAVRTRQLPHDIRSFVGRGGELARLDKLMSGPPGQAPAIVCLDGAPGTGKTTLAVHWAHRVAGRYPDVQLYLDLRGYGPGEPVAPADAAATLLRRLGVGREQVPPSLDERSALLRSTLAGRQTLLVLDNARSADQVRPLLPGSSSLVVVTSRNQLRGLAVRDGAHRVTLQPLEPDQAVELLGTAIDPGRLSAEPEAAQDLVRLCDRLPLALAIVAERAQRASSLAEVVDSLADAKARLGGEVGAALSWSYQALEPGAATMFRRLGLHPGDDVGLATAAALADLPPGPAGAALDQLVAAHLLEQRRPGRYQLHDLIRLYAAGLAAQEPADERDDAVRRLLDRCLYGALGADHRLNPLRRQDYVDPYRPLAPPPSFALAQEALDWLDAEYDGLRAVARWAGAHGYPGYCWRIVQAMWTFLRSTLPVPEQVELVEPAVAAAVAAGEPHGRGYTRNLLGAVHLIGRDHVRADESLRDALAAFESIGHRRGQAMVLGNLGLLAIELGEHERAVGYLDRTIELSEQLGDRGGLANNLVYLGNLLSAIGRYEQAVDCHLRAQAIYNDSSDPAEANNQSDLAVAYAALGSTRAAVRAYRRAIAIRRGVGDRRGEADALLGLGRVLGDAGHDGIARGLLRLAHDALADLADPRAAEIAAKLGCG